MIQILRCGVLMMNIKRSLLKGLTWELIGLLILYFLTSSVTTSLLYVVIRIVTFPLHEWVKKLTYGKK